MAVRSGDPAEAKMWSMADGADAAAAAPTGILVQMEVKHCALWGPPGPYRGVSAAMRPRPKTLMACDKLVARAAVTEAAL